MRSIALILLTIILFLITNQVVSQNPYLLIIRIKDKRNNQPIENASVKIQNTNNGTISSKEGICELIVNTIPVNLEVSHVAYENRIVTINPKQIHDTINVFLNQLQITLNEVNISAKKVDTFIQTDYTIVDFNFCNNQLLVLEADNNKVNTYRLILMNTYFDTITLLNLAKRKKPLSLFKDCMEQCHLLTKDSAFQIHITQTLLSLDYPLSIKKFHEILDDCLFLVDSLVYFQRIVKNGYSYEFYTVNVKNKKVYNFTISTDYERLKSLQESIKFLIAHPPSYSLNVAIDFEKRFMYKPFNQHLKYINDTIYYFNYQNSTIDIYSKKPDFIRKVNVNYHKNTGWTSEIIMDKIKRKFYTIVKHQLFEINLSNGKTVLKANIGLPTKTLIHNGYAYILKKEYKMNQIETFISKIELK